MGLLDKLEQVEIKADSRLPEDDLMFCETHQQAYDESCRALREIRQQWKKAIQAQRDLLGIGQDGSLPYFGSNYRFGITDLNRELEKFHSRFISELTQHFNEKYCCFEPPLFQEEIQELEQRFTELYQSPKKLDEITLDMVIMAPEMVRVISADPRECKACELYLLTTHCTTNLDSSSFTELYADYDAGRFALLQRVREEQQDGCVKDWADRDVLEEEYGIDRYEAWYRNEYFENHFAISLEKLSLMLPPDFMENPKSYN